MSISTDPSGQWIASGSIDGTVRIWEVETGRSLRVWESPCKAGGQDVLILNTGIGDEIGNMASVVSWLQDDKHEGIRLRHFKTVSSVELHRKGDYLSTVMPADDSRAILMHQVSKKLTQRIPFKLHGLPVSTVFHRTRSIFFIATKNNIRVYDLLKQSSLKSLRLDSVKSHPLQFILMVIMLLWVAKRGNYAGMTWILSSKPYKTLKNYPKDITNVAFHRSYPLFASCSDACTAYFFHSMVYADLNQNPLIVPLEILHGHTNSNGRGVMDCKFHPRQPWLFTAGADSLIKLHCH